MDEPEEEEPEEGEGADIVLRARASDPETSHAAMAAFDKGTMSKAATLVAELYQAHGPMADYQLRDLFEEAYPHPHCRHLYQQARSTARDRGQLRDSGEKRRNPASKRWQVVWEAYDGPPPVLQRCTCCGQLMRRISAKKES